MYVIVRPMSGSGLTDYDEFFAETRPKLVGLGLAQEQIERPQTPLDVEVLDDQILAFDAAALAGIAQQGSATMAAMAPGVSAALITTVAGLLVAIPSMFGYNWLVHNLRVLTVELDNFAQELVSKMETEFLEE